MDSNLINVKIQNVTIKTLIDTGASVSCISKTLLHKLQKLSHDRPRISQSRFQHAFGVGGEILNVQGCVSLDLDIEGTVLTHTFHVFDRIHHALILGLDFLQDKKCSIDLDTFTLRTSKQGKPVIATVKTVTPPNFEIGIARSSEGVIIPPFHYALVPVKLSRVPNNGSPILLEPIANLSSKYCLAGARSINIPKNSTCIMKIVNPMPTPATIYQSQILGKLFPISTIQCIDKPIDENNMVNSLHSKSQSEAEYIKIAKDFGIDFTNCNLPPEHKRKLMIFLGQNHDVFAKSSSDIGCTNVYQHHIETGNNPPYRQRPYRQTPAGRELIDQHVKQMLADGIIVESNSTWSAPVVMVKKRNGEMRFTVDFRGLNARTEPIHFPIPDLQDALDSVGTSNSKIFSTMDLKSSFHQIPLSPSSAHKTTFVTHDNSYHFTRVPFGITAGPMCFQMVMSKVLRGINFKYALVFIDDILCHSPDIDTHISHLSTIFERLREANLKLNPKKCQFATKKVEYLGHTISEKGIEASPSKISAILDYPRPKTVKQVRGFLGLANFYRRYVKDFSTLAHPLNQLLKKTNKRLQWSTQCEKAFNTLKEKLTTPPILAFPNLNKPFAIAVDASGTGIGYILSQFDNGNEHVISYGGRSLRGTEYNWSVTHREGLALVEAVKHYHPYIANQHFDVYTDHISLKWLKDIKLETGRLARWSLLLQSYDFTIIHKPGIRNQNADALSRRPYDTQVSAPAKLEDEDWDEIIATVNTTPSPSYQVPLPPKDKVNTPVKIDPPPKPSQPAIITLEYPTGLHINKIAVNDDDEIIRPSVTPSIEKETGQTIPYLQWQCPDLRPILDYLENGSLPLDQKAATKLAAESQQYVVNDNILYHFLPIRTKTVPRPLRYQKQLAVPTPLRQDIINSYHDAPGGSHFGFDKTYSSIRLKYYWPNMYRDIENHIKSCDPCQRASRDYNQKPTPLNPLPVSEPFSRLHMDILGPLTLTPEGFKYILLVVDSCTGWIEGFPMVNQNAETVADLLFSQIICRYGAPHSIVSDQGANFLSAVVQSLCEFFNVTRHKTSAYHPACNGRVEVMNSVIAKSLRAQCSTSQEKWAKHLPGILLGLRLSQNSSTNFSPYYMVFGHQMRLPVDCSLLPKDNLSKSVKQYIEEIKEVTEISLDIAKQNTEHSKQKQKEYHDKNAVIPNYRIGDKVLIKNHKIIPGESKKLSDKYKGPFIVCGYNDKYNVKLKRVSDNKILPNFWHPDNIKPYFDHSIRTAGDSTKNDTASTAQTSHDSPTSAHNSTVKDTIQQTNEEPQTTKKPKKLNFSTSPAVLPDGWFEVERIISGRFENGKQFYKVKWKGYPTPTMEPEENIDPQLLYNYLLTHTKQGTKRKRPATKRKRFFKNKN
jgi:hypothetical protein